MTDHPQLEPDEEPEPKNAVVEEAIADAPLEVDFPDDDVIEDDPTSSPVDPEEGGN